MQVQDFRLAREQIVTNAESLHRVDDALDVACGDVIGEHCDRVVAAFFKRVQHFVTQFQLVGIHVSRGVAVAVEETDLRVEIPAVIVEWMVFRERRIERFDPLEVHLLDMKKSDDDVSHLDAGVVDVILDFDAVAGSLQDAYEGVAQHGVAHVTDVRGFVWVDARVLDHLLWSIDVLSA